MADPKRDEIPAEDELAQDKQADLAAQRSAVEGEIIRYKDADKATKIILDKIIREFEDAGPDNINAIQTFGQEPLDAIMNVAEEVIRSNDVFRVHMSEVGAVLHNVKEGMKNIKAVPEKMKDVIDQMAGAAEKGVSTGGGVLKTAANKVLRRKSDKEKADELEIARLDQLEEDSKRLPELTDKVKDVVKEVKVMDGKLETVITTARRLGQTYLDAYYKLALYSAAADEIMRRYPASYIRDAEEDYKNNPTPFTKKYRDDVVDGMTDFRQRVLVLSATSTQSMTTAQSLQEATNQLKEMRKITQEITTTYQGQWLGQIAAAGVLASTVQASKALQEHLSLGDQILDQTMRMNDESSRLSKVLANRNIANPAKIIAAAEQAIQTIEQREALHRERELAVIAATELIRGAQQKVIEASKKADEARVIGSGSATNDNGATPASTKKRTPRPPRP